MNKVKNFEAASSHLQKVTLRGTAFVLCIVVSKSGSSTTNPFLFWLIMSEPAKPEAVPGNFLEEDDDDDLFVSAIQVRQKRD